ncbi:MAG TPA: pilus assembly protein TadG-related protein [Terriglobales bacterium]|nr:pilus assembly protein TadG-related protein [Terriglobales bacterium]
MQKKLLSRQRPHEQGQTIILVAISLVSLLAMAALAIDIVTLYVARSEIQRAADTAALAGAKAIADSGITTLLLTDPTFLTVKPWAQNMKNKQIDAILPNDLVAGQKPTLLSAPVDWTQQGNPHVTVTLQVSLPTFFSKIWGRTTASVTATAAAEAYNPANVPNFTPIAPKAVKPWLVANIDPNHGTAFVDASGAIELNVIGETLNLTADCQPGPGCTLLPLGNPPGIGPSNSLPSSYPQVEYVPALVTPNAGSNVCPTACLGDTDYERSIECADVTTSYQVLSCGGGANNATWDNSVNPGGLGGLSDLGAECLIHATGRENGKGQDELDPSPWPGNPMKITAESGPQKDNLVTTSSSIVTIPIIDRTTFQATSPFQVTVVGFLQAFIDEVHGVPPSHQGDIQIHILNIAGCSTTPNSANPVVGGSGTSPVPVRLITPP